MIIDVKLENKWDKDFVLKWLKYVNDENADDENYDDENTDGEQYEDLSREDMMELYLLADLISHHPDVPFDIIKEVAPITIEEAIERGFDEIIYRWISHKQLARDIDDELKKNETTIMNN